MEGESCGGGVIINTASEAAMSLAPLIPVYVTSKYATLGFTREIATFDPIVVRKRIRVNALCPPGILTNLHRTRKMENELYDNIFQPIQDVLSENDYTTQELAQHFVKLIEEPYHAAAMYVPKEEIIPDETKPFRERTGLEDTYMKLRDAAVQQL
ncbi:uncharacterized protein [Amphiura filiformis]|uniref:uncharacterized protein n=1 Tax=Amphiura filiformis TaxID=82378 RepID=UPI003B20D0F5